LTLYEDVLCPICGSLCDDIAVEVENNQVKEIHNACTLGVSKIKMDHDRFESSMLRRNGKLVPCSYDEAVDASAKILNDARRPFLYGWSSSVCEAMQAGMLLAEEVGGVVDNTSSVCHGPSVLAQQAVGRSGSTLGQIKNRADLVIYWGCNPAQAHPRHMSRYTVFPRGFFRPKGVKDRSVVLIDVRETATAHLANEFVKVDMNGDYPVLQALRAILRGHGDDLPDMISGVPRSQLFRVADMCRKSKFGVIFFGMGLTMSRCRYKNIESAISLTAELSQVTKFVIIPMRGHFNVAGANMVSLWESGFPFAVDFSKGYPYYNPGETATNDLLMRMEADAAFIISSDPGAHFPQASLRHLANIPVIQVDPYPNPTSEMADVVIPTQVSGIECAGTAYRMDSVPIRMRKVLESDLPSDRKVVEDIYARVRELKSDEGCK